MSGGKGGSQTTQVEIPQWLSNAAQANLAQGRDVSRIGYTPYYGPDVAALAPAQQAARANVGQFAQAFGMQGIPESSLGQPTTYAGGIQGYSAGGLYDQAVQELASRRPGQYSKMMENFVDPYGQGGYQDRYQNYFNTGIGQEYGDTYMPSATIPATQYSGPATANVALNDKIYNLTDPTQLSQYQQDFAASQNVATQQPAINVQPQVTAESAVSSLRSAPDWRTLTAQQKIQRVVDMANQTGLSAGELAAVLPYDETVIEGYM